MKKNLTYQKIEEKTEEEILHIKMTVQSYKLTDLGNSERFISEHKENIRFNEERKKWLVWNGKIWEVDVCNAKVITLAKETVRNMLIEASCIMDMTQRKLLIKHSFKSESERSIKAMIALAQADKSIIIKNEELDANPFLFNCDNGTIDLKTGELLPHNKKDFITKISPIKYDANATCPLWNEFLNKITNNNPLLIQYLSNAVGYSMTGDTRSQVLFFLYGLGSNGKSTFINVIRNLMSDYGGTAPINLFLSREKYGTSNRESLANLQGKRFISSSEIEIGKRLSTTIIKEMTGGEAIRADRKYEHEIEFQPTHKIWISGNHKPQIIETGEAIWRRIKLIPFMVTIPNEEKDEKLLEKLKKEMSGILSWAVRGCLNWEKNGLQEPIEVEIAVKKYRVEEDILGEYLEDCCVIKNSEVISKKDLYVDYKKWCEKQGVSFVISQKMFGTRLLERGILDTVKQNVRVWVGIGLKYLNNEDAQKEIDVSKIGF